MFKIRRAGVAQLQNDLSDGLEAVAEKVLDTARSLAPVEMVRDPAWTRDLLHVVTRHSRAWPKPAVFVVTGSKDGFFVHEGTSHTPAYPFLSQALDQVRSQIPSIIRGEALGKRGRRTQAFTDLNRAFDEFGTHRE